MPDPSGEQLALATRTAVVRAAALAGRVGPEQLAALLYRAGGTAVGPREDPRRARALVDRAERCTPQVARALEPYARTRSPHWNGWTAPGTDTATQVHKVYVSPTVACLRGALPLVFATAVTVDVPSWKVGADAPGLHRPDKIVLYLPSADRADAVAGLLARVLAGLGAQGVPFTGQVGASPMVSRGRDDGSDSWRARVCRAVAVSLVDRRVGLGPDASPELVADAALAALAGDYDVRTWHPELRAEARA